MGVLLLRNLLFEGEQKKVENCNGKLKWKYNF